MIECNNGIVSINSDTHIVLSNVITVGSDYQPSMFSEGIWQLKINGIAVYSHYDNEKIRAMVSFVKARLEEFYQ